MKVVALLVAAVEAVAAQAAIQEDPCAIPFEDATRIISIGNATSSFLRSDYFEKCYENLAINTDNMVEHIAALNAYFEEYYCFYNIAKDPSASSPKGHQPELGQSQRTSTGAWLRDLAGGDHGHRC
jgi:hypothetical protein